MGIGQGVTAIVGRRTELDLLGGVLRNLDRGSGVTIRMRGDAGLGKTTLLDWAETQTSAAVIRLTGSESDAELAYSGIASFTKALRNLRVTVPDPHAQVLSAATDGGSPQGLLKVSGATLAALAAVGEQTPLLLLIDDAQWVDDASCAALAFALRRLPDEPVVAIITERSNMPSPFDNAGFETVDLKGLDVDEAAVLLGDRSARGSPVGAEELL